MPSFLPGLVTLVCSSVLLVSRLVDISGTLTANIYPGGAPNSGKRLLEMGKDCVHGAIFIGVIDNVVSSTVRPLIQGCIKGSLFLCFPFISAPEYF